MARAFRIKPWLVTGFLALSPLSVEAAGLGKLIVTSALGQPLRAEIELVDVQKDELKSIVARIASAEAYKEASIERSGALLDIRFSVEQKKTGAQVVKLTTSKPVNEPFLDMLIELNWAAGRLLREYTLLLDPPGYAETQSVQGAVVPSVKPVLTEPQAPVPTLETSPAPGVKADAAKPVATPRPVAEATISPGQQKTELKEYGPVKEGETLTAIASQLVPEGYNLEQMLVVLYQANKNSFGGSNMNRLKTGQILRVPEKQQLAAIGRSEAAYEVKAHTADWNAYRQKLAAAVTEAPPAKDEVARQEAKGKITTAVEDKAAAPAASKDVLKVSKGESPADGKDLKALQSKAQSLQEEATAREKELKDTGSRIAAMEKNLKEMQQLLEMKNQTLADLQKQLGGRAETAPPTPIAAADEPMAKSAEPVTAPVEAAKKVAAKSVKTMPAKQTAPDPGLLDAITDDPLYLAGGVGALALLGGGAVVAINRRRRKNQ